MLNRRRGAWRWAALLLLGANAARVASQSLDTDVSTDAPAPHRTPWPVEAKAVPAYVISLRRTAQRWKYFEKDGQPFRVLPRLERFNATDGLELAPATDDRFSLVARLNILRGTRRGHAELVTIGMAGLYISHMEVWAHFLAEGPDEPLAIVLEDDAEVPDDLTQRMDAAMARMPPSHEWDVWILGALKVVQHAPSPGGPPALREVREYFGTQAYVISRRGAQRLLALGYPMVTQVDAFMSQATELRLIRTLWWADGAVTVPQALRFFDGRSTLQQLYCDLCDLPHDYNRARDISWWMVVGGALCFVVLNFRRERVRTVAGTASRVVASRCSACGRSACRRLFARKAATNGNGLHGNGHATLP